METLKNTLKNLILNSSTPTQVLTFSYGMFRIFVDDLIDEDTFEITKELRLEGFEHLSIDGQVALLKKAIDSLS